MTDAPTRAVHTIRVRFPYAVVAALLALLVFAFGELARIGGPAAVPWWADGGWTVSAVAAVAGCLAARRRDPTTARTWTFFACGCATWLCGQLVWDYYQLVARQAPPFPSWGDAGWLGFVPWFVIGILALLRGERQRAISGLLTVDVAIVALTSMLLGLVADQGLLLSDTHVTLVGRAVAVAYPVSYLSLGLAAFVLAVRVPHLAAAPGMALLILGLFLEGLGFVGWAPLLLGGTYQDGTILDLVWMAGLLAIALAGTTWQAPRRRKDQSRGDHAIDLGISNRSTGVLMPLILQFFPTILALGGAVIAPTLVGEAARGPIELGARGLIGLIVLRQIAAMVENTRLYRAEAMHRGLAQLRAERLRRVQAMGQALHLDLDQADIGQLVADAACALGYRVAILNLVSNPGQPLDEQRLRAVATAGLPSDVEADFLAYDAPATDIRTLLRDEFRLSRSYYLPAAQAAALFPQTDIHQWTPPMTRTDPGGWQAGDEFTIPLIERRTSGMMGFISVDAPLDGRAPDLEAAEMLEILADQAALALQNNRLYEQAQTLAMRDSVTGLANHRALQQALDAALAAAAVSVDSVDSADSAAPGRQIPATPVSVLLLDLDNFKLFNDTYGHHTGDGVLCAVAQHLRSCLDGLAGSVVGRHGGDEFAVVLPGADRDLAHAMARRITATVAATPYEGADGAIIPLSVSIGLATAPWDGTSRQALFAVADARMYATKSGDISDPVLERSAGDLLGETAFGILEALVTAVNVKDRYTREHSLDVTRYALDMADMLGLDDNDRRALAVACPLHDIGKIAVPDRVLRKPGRLTDEEHAIIQSHVIYGVSIIRGLIDDPAVLDIVAHHHERYDGRGYPYGVAGAQTSLLARIVQVADAVSAMTLDRPYRRGLPPEHVIAELRRGAGVQFDPTLVEPFITVFTARHGIVAPRRADVDTVADRLAG